MSKHERIALDQLGLFDEAPSLPAGFCYRDDLLSIAEERELVERFSNLPFQQFEFHRYRGKRRIVSFGWKYDFAGQTLRKSEQIPAFLLPLRDRAGVFAGLAASDMQHVLVTEYANGAGIGWHRDKTLFEDVVAVSFLSPCVLRFRRKQGAAWQRASLIVRPRSA